ncbi:MbcA/ParS/Xre antitoxin family protein [Vibrio celticus]|uniref:Antitoxin Xre/MbcA/ParS-like toxin-binding domain-containing protein n=1 Tax=Vibrio celticus TaxID=446372 RepID=A0A1C3JC69_9VIBR|nr:MbcA/ParS/Xre antitoxin family protein [Vibrio celticus]SBT12730.1 hypothetical protein VCE7224_01473 [Vibrio celticus]
MSQQLLYLKNLKPDHTNKSEVAVIKEAESIFSSLDKALRWMTKPKKQFSGMTPLDMIQRGQRDQVSQLLTKINQGSW